jgi:hypothetical protein
MQIKITLRYQFIIVKVAIFKRRRGRERRRGGGRRREGVKKDVYKLELLGIFGRKVKW